METFFEKIGLAITFSPSGKRLLEETIKLRDFFNSELILIHAGRKNGNDESKIKTLIRECSTTERDFKIVCSEGDPAHAILSASKKEGINLLVAGALEREKLFKYYFGSVARTLMRKAKCSLLILNAHRINNIKFRKIFVPVEYTPESERAINAAAKFASIENDAELHLVREIHTPALTITAMESGSLDKADASKQRWYREEKSKLDFYIRELYLRDMKIYTHILSDKENLHGAGFARENSADLLVLARSLARTTLLDRFLTQDLEIIFENLPSNLLLIR